MTEKVYGIWLKPQEIWAIDSTGSIIHSIHRVAMAAQARQWLCESHSDYTSAIARMIGKDGLPERPCTCHHWPCICPVKEPEKEAPKADLLPVAHPCPICGNGPIDMDVRGCGQSHRVQCLRCNAQGPMAGSDRAAIEGWNRRKPPWPEEETSIVPAWIDPADQPPDHAQYAVILRRETGAPVLAVFNEPADGFYGIKIPGTASKWQYYPLCDVSRWLPVCVGGM